MEKDYLKNLKSEQDKVTNRLNELVIKSVNEQNLISQNLANEPQDLLTQGEALADKVASFGGSWKFIILFGSIILAWIVINTIILTTNKAFDPYPFILLNLVLSCLAALQAPVIMMSQNRQSDKDRKQAQNDYMVTLKTEIELKTLDEKINLLMKEQMNFFLELEKNQLNILSRIEQHIDPGK